MAFSFTHSIMPMSELRANPQKVKRQLKKSPVIITVNGKPDFGICDLDTLEFANQIKERKDLLIERKLSNSKPIDIDVAFEMLEKKYSL